MKMKQLLFKSWPQLAVAPFLVSIALLTSALPSRANVFASNIRLNGGSTNALVGPGGSVTISYILNEAASSGIKVEIIGSGSTVRTFTLSPGTSGTSRGTNSINWDLRDNSSNAVPLGAYSVKVTAASLGYPSWTHIISEEQPDSPSTFVYDGRGIAAQQNLANPYFGRVLVANSAQGNLPGSIPGDNIGILKYNADGSAPEDGIVSTDGHNWPGNELGPWKVEVSGDFAYANDMALNGEVFRWDLALSSSSLLHVLRQDNRPGAASLAGLAIANQGTNTQLWSADRSSSSAGVLRWTLQPDGTCAPGDTGTNVITLGVETNGLTLPPQDVALDTNGNIYVCQAVTDQASAVQRVFRFKAYDPATNSGAPATSAEWAVGAGDDTYGGASGIAVDPTGTYVAVSFLGVTVFGLSESGNTKVLYATNGALVANLDLGVPFQGDSTHQDTDCCWDAAGNVYYIDNWTGHWRAVSPPGTNQFVSLASASVVIFVDTAPPAVTGVSVSNGVVLIQFTASVTDVPANFRVMGTTNIGAPFTEVQNAQITATGAGAFTAAIPASASMQFFRVERATTPPPQSPQITSLSVSNGIVNITFTGNAADQPSAFALFATGSLNSGFQQVTSAQFSLVSPGSFKVTVPANGPAQFYRIRR